MLVPGIRPRTWPSLAAFAARHSSARCTVGIHPHVVPELAADELADFEGALVTAARSAGAVAIGECRLDGAT
jgi:TatD DNase family protein